MEGDQRIDSSTLMRENEERLTHINSLTEQLLKLEHENVRQNQEAAKVSEALSAEVKAKELRLSALEQELREEAEKTAFFEGKLKEAEEYIFECEQIRETEHKELQMMIA